ncbi:9367_t:CDS:2 [Funneliformis geosporum]|uniref:9367_t:CDS:1 n=1 Tax=Funneliformis geosporum TaxID=1117311 RepID=A0A9W4SNN0_9GLOM|nr:9367_t:CDS:2 [Funneliformis geosporum]
MEIDKKVKLNETLQVMSEVNKENKEPAKLILVGKGISFIGGLVV